MLSNILVCKQNYFNILFELPILKNRKSHPGQFFSFRVQVETSEILQSSTTVKCKSKKVSVNPKFEKTIPCVTMPVRFLSSLKSIYTLGI